MQLFLWIFSLVVVLLAAAIDIRSRRIPNWLSLPAVAAGLIANTANDGWAGLSRSFGGIALAILLVGSLCAIRTMGMGDLKLCAAVGALVGASALLFALVVTAMAGGLIAGMAVLMGQSRGPHTFRSVTDPEAQTIPYAPAIAIGVVVSFFAN